MKKWAIITIEDVYEGNLLLGLSMAPGKIIARTVRFLGIPIWYRQVRAASIEWILKIPADNLTDQDKSQGQGETSSV